MPFEKVDIKKKIKEQCESDPEFAEEYERLQKIKSNKKGILLLLKKIFHDIRITFITKLYEIEYYFEVKRYKKLYQDYEDNEYNSGSLKFIWGIKSWDDLTGKDASLYTMNDIDITYDRDSKLYMLGIETAYKFQNKEAECKYLRRLFDFFTKFMNDNGYATDFDKCLYFSQPPTLLTTAESIEELYINFKIFVEGYCMVYGY